MIRNQYLRKILLLLIAFLSLGINIYFLTRYQGPILNQAEAYPIASSTLSSINSSSSTEIPQSFNNKFYCPILMYHHVALKRPQESYYVSPETFEKQMQWLKDNNFKVISLDEFYQAATGKIKLPAKPVVITFDDGNADNYNNAYPILKKYGYTATFFIKVSILDKQYYMTTKMIKEMSDNGMTIGSHTIKHQNMKKLDMVSIRRELTSSKKILAEKTGKPINFFAYPGGAFTPAIAKEVEKTGYELALTTVHQVFQNIKAKNDLYTIPRIHIDDEMPSFIRWIEGKNLR